MELQERQVNKLTNEQLIAKRDSVKEIIEDAEKLLKEIDSELIERADRTEDKKLIVGDRHVTIVQRASYKNVPLEFAEKYNAYKIVVDGAILGAFLKKGLDIPNLTYTKYLMVK